MPVASKAPIWPGARPVKTCTECKQSKLRCDSRARFPNPCSRCELKGVNCTVDPTFQRTPARKRLEAMSKELQELRNKRSYETPSKSPAPTDSGASFNSPLSPDLQSSSDVDRFEMNTTMIYLKDIAVAADSAIHAFKIFTTIYRPQLPILGPICMADMYQHKPFLFWTIMAIVTSHLSDSPVSGGSGDVYDQLKEAYADMVRAEVLRAPVPLSTVQAIIYLCHWPMPIRHQYNDPTWLYCGLAVNASTTLVLHREYEPSPNKPARIESSQSRNSAWLGVFYISTSQSMHLGLPPQINSDQDISTIRSYLEDSSIPLEFATELRIQLVVAKFTNILSHGVSEAVDSSLVRLFDAEIDSLKATLGTAGYTSGVEFNMLTVKLHFYAMFLVRASPGTTNREILLKMILAAATRVIHLATTRLQEPPTQASSLGLSQAQYRKTAPKNYFRAVAFATVLLLKYFSLNKGAHGDEKQLASNHVMLANNIFRSTSTEVLDEYSRASILFETLGRMKPITSEDSVKLKCTDRMGVSILVDAMWTANEMRMVPQPTRSMGGEASSDLSLPSVDSQVRERYKAQQQQQQQQEQRKGSSSQGNNDQTTSPSEEGGGGSVVGVEGMGEYSLDQLASVLPAEVWDDPMWNMFQWDFQFQ